MWLPISFFALLELGLLGVTAQTDIIPVSDPTVVIEQGTVQGSVSNHGNFEFYGIPYADATSGTNRFKAPNLPPIFADTFVANRKDVKCVRALGAGYEGTEDCLVANVFTPTLDNTTQLSVMVWVKGKEFDKMKDMDQSFENFVHKNIVVVSLNYRESVLGFLCLGTEVAPGNAGLKDIVAGLRWVRENIAQFGGNPDDITLIGHGSGAAAVDLITLSPMAYGLVNKAIVQSGSALSPWAVARDNLEYAIQVAEALGHRITNIDELSEIFERTSVAALMGVINELDLTDNSLAFAPCVERDNLTGIVPFISKTPYEIIQSGEFTQIPLIMGYVDNEGTIRSQNAVEDDWLVRMDQSFNEFLQPDLKFESQSQEAQIAERIRTRYFENDPIDMDHAENYIAYHGDTMILVSTIREVQTRLAASNSPVYLYQFSYKGILGESLMGPLAVNTAAHSEELAYMLFDSTNNQIQFRDMVIGDILIERWTNFAKTGNPTSESSNTVWSPFTSTQSSFLRFLDDEEISELSIFDLNLVDPHPTTMTFWNEIYTECFLDAESTWELTDRTDEEGSGEDSGEGSGEGSAEGSGEGSEEESGEGSGGGSGEGSEEGSGEGNGDDDNNSASTAVGYTFSIITVFAVINKFHSTQILS